MWTTRSSSVIFDGDDSDGSPFVMGVYPMLSDDSCWFLAATSMRKTGGATSRLLPRPASFTTFLSRSSAPVRERRPRLDIFRGSSSCGRGPAPWGVSHHANHGASPRYRVQILRSLFSEPGHAAGRGIWQPHRSAAARARAKRREQCFHRRGGRALSGPMGVSLRPASMPRITRRSAVEEASASGKILSVRMPLVDEDEEPWLVAPVAKARAAGHRWAPA